MASLANLPIMELILAAEEKHGIDVNMVIEAMPKNDKQDDNGEDYNPFMSPSEDDEVQDTDVVWYVEFKDIKKFCNSFEEVKKFFLEEVGEDAVNLVVPISPVDVVESDQE
jgi:hypothetical protein